MLVSAAALSVTLVFVVRGALSPTRDGGIVLPHGQETGLEGPDGQELVRSTRTTLRPLASPMQENPTTTVRSWLADYWGPEWPAVRERLEAQGDDLDVPFLILDWNVVAEDVRLQLVYDDERRQQQIDAAVGWSDEPLTAERLTAEFGFEPPVLDWEVAEMQALAAEHNVRIRTEAEACQTAIGDAVQSKWDAEDFQRAPYSTASFERVGGPGYFVGRAGGMGGWTAAVHLHTDEFPHLVVQLQGLARMRAERDEALQRRARER